MKTRKKKSATNTRFRTGTTGECEAQLWPFIGAPEILPDGETGNAIPRESCGLRAPVPSERRTVRRSRDRAVPAADSDPAAESTPEPAAGSEVCCLCHARGPGLRKVTGRPGSEPELRPSAAPAAASGLRWRDRARWKNRTRSAPLHRPTTERCCVWLFLPAGG